MKQSVLLLLLSLLALSSFSFQIPEGEPEFLVRHRKNEEILRILPEFGGDFDDSKEEEGFLDIFLSRKDLDRFLELFPSTSILEQALPLEQKYPKGTKWRQSFLPSSSKNLPSGYLDLDELWAGLNSLASSYPSLLKIVNMTQYGPGRTFEGREMPMAKLSDNVEKDEDEPNVLIVSSHHSREIINPHIALDLLTRLLKGYTSGDARIRSIVDGNEIFVSPLWNPDGYDHVWKVNNMWRKNRKPTSSSGVYGVDQNRNYLYGWDKSCSGSSVPSSETYKGPSAGSEEESQIMIAFGRDRVFAKVNDFHSYGREVLHSFVCEPFPKSLDDYVTSEAKILASKTGIPYATRKPSGDGQHQQFHLKEATAYAFLTETQRQFQPPYSEALEEMEYLWPLNLHFLERPIPFSGHVLSSSGDPIQASISIQGVDTVSWRSSARFGSFNIFLPDGTYTISFSASGYATGSMTVTISNSVPTSRDIVLQRA